MPQTIRHLTSNDYRIMKWKNGKGETSEIALSPPNANFPQDPFLWRLSSAKITESGPFSTFNGYDRLLTVGNGNGLILKFLDAPHTNSPFAGANSITLSPGEICHFSGNRPVECELVDGPITDLGLIFNRERVSAKMRTIEYPSTTSPQNSGLAQDTQLFYALSGTWFIDHYTLKEGETLMISNPSIPLTATFKSTQPFATAPVGKLVSIELSLQF